jgi:hypothetical protein
MPLRVSFRGRMRSIRRGTKSAWMLILYPLTFFYFYGKLSIPYEFVFYGKVDYEYDICKARQA